MDDSYKKLDNEIDELLMNEAMRTLKYDYGLSKEEIVRLRGEKWKELDDEPKRDPKTRS